MARTRTMARTIDRAASLLGIGSLETCSLDYLVEQATLYLIGCNAYWPDEDGEIYFGGGSEGIGAAEWERLHAAALIINHANDQRRS